MIKYFKNFRKNNSCFFLSLNSLRFKQLSSLKNAGFSLFELTLTIVITSIVFSVVGVFAAKPMLLFLEMSQQANSTAQLNIGLRRIAGDFSQYAGGISIYSNTANTLSLQFNMPNSVTVTYLCDLNAGLVYRQLNSQGAYLLLNNITGCIFRNNISSDGKTIFLNVRLVINKNNIPVALTEVINAPNV